MYSKILIQRYLPRAIYIEDSVDSLSKQDHLNTYCASSKLDYCNQYEMKADGEVEESDPDLIPCHYGKGIHTIHHQPINAPTAGTGLPYGL
jgi:hypothetical protein